MLPGGDNPYTQRFSYGRPRLTLAEVAIDVGRTHPDEILLQSAVRVDPATDVGLVGAPERLRGVLPARQVKAEARGRRHADLVAGDVAEQDRTCRLAGSDDAHIDAAGGETRPAGTVLRDAAAVVVVDVDGLSGGGPGNPADEDSKESS